MNDDIYLQIEDPRYRSPPVATLSSPQAETSGTGHHPVNDPYLTRALNLRTCHNRHAAGDAEEKTGPVKPALGERG